MQAKPCPFCGCKQVTRRARRNGLGWNTYLQCHDCGATGPQVYVEDLGDRKRILENVRIQTQVLKFWCKRAEI